MKLKVIDIKGKDTGRKISLPNKIFDVEPNNEEEHTPQLFSNENETQIENNLDDSNGNLNDSHVDEHTEKLFDQDSNEEEDFEIPAFLRKQKF